MSTSDLDFIPRVIARRQGAMLRKICPAIGGVMIECGKCNQLERITMLYKCRWCAVWYCHTCAADHFGPDSEQSRDN